MRSGTPSQAEEDSRGGFTFGGNVRGEVKAIAVGSHVDQGLESSRIQNGVVDLKTPHVYRRKRMGSLTRSERL